MPSSLILFLRQTVASRDQILIGRKPAHRCTADRSDVKVISARSAVGPLLGVIFKRTNGSAGSLDSKTTSPLTRAEPIPTAFDPDPSDRRATECCGSSCQVSSARTGMEVKITVSTPPISSEASVIANCHSLRDSELLSHGVNASGIPNQKHWSAAWIQRDGKRSEKRGRAGRVER